MKGDQSKEGNEFATYFSLSRGRDRRGNQRGWEVKNAQIFKCPARHGSQHEMGLERGKVSGGKRGAVPVCVSTS